MAKDICKIQSTAYCLLPTALILMNGKHWSVVLVLISIISLQGGASIAKALFGEVGPAGAATLRIGLAGLI